MPEKVRKTANLEPLRHTLAHTLAAAIQLLWPKTKFGVGPATEDGFYYDIDPGVTISPDDLPKIEAKMRELIEANHKLERFDLKIDQAIAKYKQENQPYKVELLNDLKLHGTTSAREIASTDIGVDKNVEKVTTVSFYRLGKFEDLCRGQHVDSTAKTGAFKLTRASGAYWRGDENNPQLQRIYGVAFATEADLAVHLKRLEEAELRDHRKLGIDLDIFIHSELVGAGLPLLTRNGTILIQEMIKFVREINSADNYHEVRTGHMTRKELYDKSGHSEKFGDDLFVINPEKTGGDELALKPMNCPHHYELYARKLRSYRGLPVRYAEFSTLHRNEPKGSLGGLTRVRALTQDDAHAFVPEKQIESEILAIFKQVKTLLSAYSLEYHVRLSLRDKNNMKAYLGDEKMWNRAEKILEELVKKSRLTYEKAEGEAAFYGPKLDFLAEDAIGREWQVSTIQLDFNAPERFDLSYIDEKGNKQRPVVIHRALNGSLERMLGVLIEHYAGKFPLWLAPEQVRLATVNDTKALAKFTRELAGRMEQAGLRVNVDTSNESVGKKIREAELMKVPYALVIGNREMKTGRITPRIRAGHGTDNPKAMSIGQFITSLVTEHQSRAPKSSL